MYSNLYELWPPEDNQQRDDDEQNDTGDQFDQQI